MSLTLCYQFHNGLHGKGKYKTVAYFRCVRKRVRSIIDKIPVLKSFQWLTLLETRCHSWINWISWQKIEVTNSFGEPLIPVVTSAQNEYLACVILLLQAELTECRNSRCRCHLF